MYYVSITSLRTDGFEIIGYARKSPGEQSNDKRKANFQNMINCLRKRSLAELIYISPQCLAGSPIASKDMPDVVEELEKMELNYCTGSTQTLLSKLSANIKKVCLVIVDYAGLSTNPDDIRTLVVCLEYIVVDRFRETGKYEVYSRSKILNNDNYLKPFACRKALPRRSK
ncbi:hypothetical protein BD770DRAFT_320880 [Pilaira anomala]|nr:hypothetical protein BD770DRAFT_320880 [Pilaira anomala]